MSIKGQISGKELCGSITGRGYSAYEVAVLNGFEGTVEEWLESLSITVVSVDKSEEDDGNNVITLSDGSVITIKNGSKGSKGDTGEAGQDGASVTVVNVSESTADSGENVITFSGGQTLTVKNGSKGSQGIQGEKGDTGKNAYEYAQEGGYSGSEAEFTAKLAGKELPAVASSNNGEFLRVVNGVWTNAIVPSAEGAIF